MTTLITNQLKKLSMSHVRLLDPVEGEKLFRLIEQKPSSTDKIAPAVSAQMKGEVGILRVKSFLIPQITRVAVEQAKAQLSNAKVILLDLRGNGGGAGSSISYLIEDLIGPDKVLWTDRTRDGLAIKQPYIFQGYFDDAINAQAEAEIKLSNEKPYTQWRTRSQAKKDPRPHFVLVDDRCGSSCDLFAAAAQEYGVKLLGVRTMGALYGGEAFKLRWQGFALIAPTIQVASPKGNTIEGVGVQPDIEIPECKSSGKNCLEKAIEVVAADAT
ncbi:S41 family peptidase [Fischerella sp. PCC 9605]|uniref:S41 family peptidase n=1 Tax=Fischerella sp. PCC 9605 TaxID=1173024 RepID=UPI001E39265D|nr:S41 family peptidase [Fischerella sp. PCC 9605]